MEDKERKEFLFKEVSIIQDIINRMSHNSFLIKGWAITLIVVTLLLKVAKSQAWITFIPLLVFWYLDAYFVWQEKMYRELYNWVITNRLKTDEHLLDMNAYRFKNNVESKKEIMLSTTLRWFYGLITILVIAFILFQH